MKNFMLFVVGILCAIAYFKWDVIKSFTEDFLAEHRDSGQISEVYSDNDDGTIDDEDRFQLASEWQNGGKRRCVERLNAMKKVFDSKTSCPAYHCAPSVTKAARSAIIDFERAIGRDDYVKAKSYDNAATDAMRRFELNCRWHSGVSRGDGTHSGHVEGTWEPDAGRVMIGGRAMRVVRCGNCSGSGQVRSVEVCSSCNGRGRVSNPAAQVSDAVNMGVGIASMFGGGKMPRIEAPRVAREINCGSCNGQGRIQVTHSCSRCNGSGKIYEP
jgi:hypothetical protein